MLCISSTLLFAIYINFLLTLGGDALKCHACSTISDSKPCEPSMVCTLTIKTATCATVKIYKNENLVLLVRDCRPEQIETCGTSQVLSNNLRAQISCCNNNDFCND